MRNTRAGRGSILNTLLASLISCCMLTVLAVLLFSYLRTGEWFTERQGRKLIQYLDQADALFTTYIDAYDTVIRELSDDSTIRDALQEGKLPASAALHDVITSHREEWAVDPLVHIVSPDGTGAVSSGFGTDKYRAGRYAPIRYLLEQRESSLYFANRFVDAEGESVVMTAADAIREGEEILGYVFLDVRQSELTELFSGEPNIRVGGLPGTSDYIIFTDYNYLIYNETNFRDITYTPNGTMLRGVLTNAFRDEKTDCFREVMNGMEYYLIGRATCGERFRIVCAVPVGILRSADPAVIGMVAVMGAVLILVCILFAFIVHNSIIGPMRGIVDTMHRYGNGENDVRCTIRVNNEIADVRDQLNQMIEETNTAIRNNNEMQEKLLLSEDNFLKAQIKPHFLNNVLESIRWLIDVGDVEEAEEALRTLGSMMTERMNYYSSEKEKLSDSLNFTQKYISIQQLCYGDKIKVSYDVDEWMLDAMVPTFLLQPVVENAIVHGLQPKTGEGHLSIVIREDGGCLHILVSDDGVGIPKERMSRLLDPGDEEHGIGLYNIHRRLQLSYGDAWGLVLRSEEGNGTDIEIRIPLR